MATDPNLAAHAVGVEDLKRNWGMFVGFGAVMVLLGVFALGSAPFVTNFVVSVLGWMLLFGGILSVVHSFMQRRWGGYFIDLFTGLLYGIVGLMIVENPGQGAGFLTFLIALSLLLGGIFRIAIAISARFHHRPWMLLNGVISVVLGLMIWRQWPSDASWVIGMFVGVDLVFYGWSLVMLGLTVKNLPQQPA